MKINLKEYEPKREKIDIPEWTDETLYVRELLASHLELLQKYARVENGKTILEHQNALLVITSLVDVDGNSIFTEKDIKNLERQPATIIARIIAKVSTLLNINVLMM